MSSCSFNDCPGGAVSCFRCPLVGKVEKLYSVAVRPTPEEVKKHHLYYDEAYYEDREKKFMASSPEEAVALYIESDKAKEDRPDVCMKKGDHFFLRREEFKYIRAREVNNERG